MDSTDAARMTSEYEETHELPRIRRQDYERMIHNLQDQVNVLQQQVSILQGHSRELYDRVIALQDWKDKFLARPWDKR